MNVAFVPLQASYGRLKGDRLALCFGMDIDKMTYTLAHELAHHFLHYDKGNTIDSEKHDEYEEQADRADYASAWYKRLARPAAFIPPADRYVCRRDRAGVVYDKAAMLQVSRMLGHNRISVIAGHYLHD